MIPDPDKFFRKHYNVAIDHSDRRIRSYSINPFVKYGNLLNDSLETHEEICYSVTIPISKYELMTKQLAELEEERIMRQRDYQLSQLYSEYKMWLNLKR
jgi:hypothetical protein